MTDDPTMFQSIKEASVEVLGKHAHLRGRSLGHLEGSLEAHENARAAAVREVERLDRSINYLKSAIKRLEGK